MIEVRNLYPAPACSPPARTWSSNATLTTDADGHTMVTPTDATALHYFYSPFLWSQTDRFGRYVCYVLRLDDSANVPKISIASTENLTRGMVDGHVCWIAGRMTRAGSSVHEMNIQCAHVPRVTVLGCGYYEADDWARLQTLMAQGRLTIPWFGAAQDATEHQPGDVILMP
ncbi:hypothetical protein BCUN_1855 [Bifidobacterium cuniculi]|uniref:Uncharacterized protein n=2 Tax=Bifidobacterium cuniculi TaxID=1688 RepID=A0A087AFF9_9BIFI|nr:hypothetical protein [Bifidobacterium cuniculi]KFI57509.1 hypothetical protein BCUN_1855 [Bifidobacterium cuniculi]